VRVITDGGSNRLETEVKSLYDEVMTLKMVIEEAIIKGQESVGGLGYIRGADLVSIKDLGSTCVNGGSGVVGWIDDL
jgi:hypothetical protein